jgi:hypothetical protein
VSLSKAGIGLDGPARVKLIEARGTRSVVLPYFDTELGYIYDMDRFRPDDWG